MLINLSNHETSRWGAAQKLAAERLFGEVCDLPFPVIDPFADLDQISALAASFVQKCQSLLSCATATATATDHAIHVMGEMTFVHQFVKQATAAGLRCVASTTERIAVDKPDGTKVAEFRFVGFREYEER